MKRVGIQNALIAGFALLAVGLYLAELREVEFSRTHQDWDDAYMVARYAKNWLSGAGFSWNTVDGPAYGITSPLYLFAVTAVMKLTGYPDPKVLRLTSVTAGLLAVAALVLLGFIVQAGSNGRKSWLPLLAAPAVLLVPPFKEHSLSGMDTTLSLLTNSLLACSLVLAARRRTAAPLALCVVAGFLSCAARPDNGLYALLLPPLFFFATDRTLWKLSVRYAALLVLLIGCALLLGRFLFGDFLPLSFLTKAGGFYAGYVGAHQWNAMRELLVFCTAALPFLLLLPATASRKTLPQLTSVLAVLLATFAYYATVTQIMGFGARYYYPSLAFVALAGFRVAFAEPGEERTRPDGGPVRLRLLAGLGLLIVVLSGPVRSRLIDLWAEKAVVKPTAITSVTQYHSPADRPLQELGWYGSIRAIGDLLEHMPQGITIAASEYGIIGARFPELTIIDLVGLHDRTMARKGFDASYVLSREPDLLWFPHKHYTGAVAGILDHPAFQQEYEYYPGAYDYGIALRRSSASYARVYEAVSSEFLRVYPGQEISDYLAEPYTARDDE